ncbi:MAG: AIR carboxylase family protein [Myxococcales bacterium]|nr:AIR carboxylase family protein [Myxococcales bacterium]
MDARALKEFLEQVRAGKVSVDEAARRIGDLPVQHVADFAQLDGERALRQGVPEVVLGGRKSPDQIGALVAKLVSLGQAVLVTRMPPGAEKAALSAAPNGRYDPISRTFSAPPETGFHRLLRKAALLREADALVVCAGMEGALPSVVGGLVSRPVIAVPTSVGYGASFGGLAALLAMLNSCAANVSVVNIDNGFSAGFTAALIARQSHRARK